MSIIIFIWFLEAAVPGTRMTEEMQFSAHYWYRDNVNIPWILCNLAFSVLYFSALRSWHKQNSTERYEILTHECNNEDAKDDPEDVAEDVHDDDGEESHRQVELALPLLVLAPAQNLESVSRLSWVFHTILLQCFLYLTTLTYFQEYVKVHVGKSDKWKNSCIHKY